MVTISLMFIFIKRIDLLQLKKVNFCLVIFIIKLSQYTFFAGTIINLPLIIKFHP